MRPDVDSEERWAISGKRAAVRLVFYT